ncbi:hypothetical protein PHMEG_00014150 [Phytophthora megakarya]|uniref:Uncharacterized protein n=1 Tax=Phytophthora megakarya TaxID=4795 RepID=A0A225W4I9_9STRA|nr:hypothetical protein PHMEG_00014150 [Phytophthora megakarya]
MLDLVREVVNHKHSDQDKESYKELCQNGTLPHSLLVTFQSWECLGSMKKNRDMIQLFKNLLHHLNLVYPVNDLEKIDEADIIVPMYWKTRESARKPITTQKSIIQQNGHDGWKYVAKWRYSLPIVVSDVIFENFVVKCYRPFAQCDARYTRFCISIRGEFHAAIELSTNTTGRLDDITIEVEAPTKKFAWAEMRYYVIAMEKVLEKSYPGLTEHAKLKRSIVDDQGMEHDVNTLMGRVEDEARLRQYAPWLPPDFNWFILRAWKKPGVLHKLNLHHRLEVIKNLIVTNERNRLPSLWTLLYPGKGSPVEIRVHSDLSGDCDHEPLKIKISRILFTKYPNFFQVKFARRCIQRPVYAMDTNS